MVGIFAKEQVISNSEIKKTLKVFLHSLKGIILYLQLRVVIEKSLFDRSLECFGLVNELVSELVERLIFLVRFEQNIVVLMHFYHVFEFFFY
jgi:hypothetical protein